MDTIQFEKGIARLDLATLQRTVSYEQAKGGLPKNRPIEHHRLISGICDRANAINGVTVEVDPIYCTERKTLQVMWGGPKDECPVENHLVQRLTGRVQLKYKGDDAMNMAIGFSYNERGITLGFGPNIWVCSNQNVFGDNIMSTYTLNGRTGMAFDKISDVLKAWFQNFEEKREDDYGKITVMQNTNVERKTVKLLYGELIEEAVLVSDKAPMNITQVSSFVRKSQDEKYEVPVGEDYTVWDLCQMGTDVLRPHDNDLVTSYHTLNNFNNFMLDKFCN
jgi:hypothetical protein